MLACINKFEKSTFLSAIVRREHYVSMLSVCPSVCLSGRCPLTPIIRDMCT